MKLKNSRTEAENMQNTGGDAGFLLCGCNHRDTEYKLSDSTGGSTAETVFGNQKEVDEEQTVSEKAPEKPQAFRKT